MYWEIHWYLISLTIEHPVVFPSPYLMKTFCSCINEKIVYWIETWSTISRNAHFLKDINTMLYVITHLCWRWISSISSPSSSPQQPYLPWVPGQPNGGNHQACVEAKFDKQSGSFLGYNDLNCDKSLRCFFCKVPTFKTFYLRGMCKEAAMDTKLVMMIDQQKGNR